MLRLFKKKYTEDDLLLFNFLRKNRFFERLTNGELSYFAPYLYNRKYRANEVVFFTKDPSQAIYIVKSGIVTLNIDLKDGFEKLMTLRAGKLFGDNAFISGTKRLYTAIVKTEEAEIYVIPKANIMEVMNNHPEVRAKIMTAFAEQYNEYTSNLFQTYKSSLGFFDLNTVYNELKL